MYHLRKDDLFVLGWLGKGATSEAMKYLFRAANVWWKALFLYSAGPF